MINIFGFTLLRNAVKYDYCFQESLESLAGITKKVYIALGESEDNTKEVIEKYDFLNIIPTVWDMNMRKSGLILSQQTNIALEILRKEQKEDKDAWGFYLQGDEVINEEDYELIQKDIQFAHENGYDAVRFRYWHFFKNHHQVAIDSHWYPQEIRAIKLDSNIVSYGDAQSFQNQQKVYESNAFIYHYGHARSEDGHQEKYKEFHRWWHANERFIAKSIRKHNRKMSKKNIITLLFLGTHPLLMKERIESLGEKFQANTKEEIYIVADKSQFSKDFIDRINVQQIHWLSPQDANLKNIPKEKVIIFKPNFWQKIKYKSQVRTQTYSDLAITWTDETILMLKLSEKGIGLRKID